LAATRAFLNRLARQVAPWITDLLKLKLSSWLAQHLVNEAGSSINNEFSAGTRESQLIRSTLC
jgi:hypothetical protein